MGQAALRGEERRQARPGGKESSDWVPIPDPTGYVSLNTTRGYTGNRTAVFRSSALLNGEVGNTQLRLQPDPVGLIILLPCPACGRPRLLI